MAVAGATEFDSDTGGRLPSGLRAADARSGLCRQGGRSCETHLANGVLEKSGQRLNGGLALWRSMRLARKRKRRRRPARRDDVATADSFKVIYFLLPLEAPLSIPDKSIIRGQEKPPPKRGFEDDYLGIEWDDEEGLVGCRLSCCFHQINSPEIDTAQFAAFEAARIAFPSLQIDEPPSEPEPHSAAVTVAEVAVHLAERSDEAIDGALAGC